MAAAAGDKNDGKDNEPNPVVVKELAEAVVVHSEPPKWIEGENAKAAEAREKGVNRPSATSVCRRWRSVTIFVAKEFWKKKSVFGFDAWQIIFFCL